MNLIEALKSGKPFRRKLGTSYRRIDPERAGIYDIEFTKQEVLADDWELELEEPNRVLGHVQCPQCDHITILAVNHES